MYFSTLAVKRKIQYIHSPRCLLPTVIFYHGKILPTKEEIPGDQIPGVTSYKNAKQLECIQESGPKVFSAYVVFGNSYIPNCQDLKTETAERF